MSDRYADVRPQCEALIAQYPDSRSALLPIIHLFQEREGYVSNDAMRAAAAMLGLTPAEVESTVSFYTLFFRRPVGKYILQVCRGLACSLNGAAEMMNCFRERLGVGNLQTTDDGFFSYEEVECLAACDRPVCMQVNLEFVYGLTPAKIDEMLAALRAGTYGVPPMAQTGTPGRTWAVKADDQVSTGGKSRGAWDVSAPNNPGGLDASGMIMLDRILTDELRFRGRTNERLANESPAVAAALEE